MSTTPQSSGGNAPLSLIARRSEHPSTIRAYNLSSMALAAPRSSASINSAKAFEKSTPAPSKAFSSP